ncbi:MAG: hypothetical protein AB8H80_22135 [Planctomycetota bacterium]
MQTRLASILSAALLPVALTTFAVNSTAQTVRDYRAVDDAPQDWLLSNSPVPFLAIPGFAWDFTRSGGGQFVQFPNGTARLTGRIYRESNLYQAFLVDINLSGRVLPVDPNYPPANTPNQGLFASAYVPVGPINTADFVYYTTATGTLTGVRNLTGSKIELTSTSPVQLGDGANNRNSHYGIYGEFAANVLSQAPFNTINPNGNVRLNADIVAPFSESTTHPQIYTPITSLPSTRALRLPGVADDYVFVPTADFLESQSGTATVTGRLARLDDLDDAWLVSLNFGGRVDPSEPNYPPTVAGVQSPVQQLLPSSYATAGGQIDPGHWHYYTTAVGTLTGEGLNEGGVINLSEAAAVQVGAGANQLNTYFGFYGAFAASVQAQPAARTLSLTGNAELHALTASFPVLPFPSLVAAATTPQLPVLGEAGLIVEGDNLAWVSLMGINGDLLARGTADDFLNGWFRIIDNTHVEIHPRPGTLPGAANIAGYNPAVLTNQIPVDLVAPSQPVLMAERNVGAQGTIHLRMHSGPVAGPAMALMTLSQVVGASSSPGLVDLEIGANFSDILVDPVVYSHDAQTGLASMNYGPISSVLLGQTYYFEGILLDVAAQTTPLPTTNFRTITLQ